MPFYRCTLESPLSPKEVEQVINDKIRKKEFFVPSLSVGFTSMLNPDDCNTQPNKTWHGKVANNKFKIYRHINHRNSALPVLHGKILPISTNDGSEVKIIMTESLYSILFSIVFIGVSLYQYLENPQQGSIMLIGVVFIIALSIFGFFPEVNKAKKLLKTQLNAH